MEVRITVLGAARVNNDVPTVGEITFLRLPVERREDYRARFCDPTTEFILSDMIRMTELSQSVLNHLNDHRELVEEHPKHTNDITECTTHQFLYAPQPYSYHILSVKE